MADIRINALATTAASTASDDFIAVDGSANGTRKLNAYSPTFGGNVTASNNLTVGGDVILSTNNTFLKGKTSGGSSVNLFSLTSDTNNLTRFIAGVDAGGFQWTNQAQSAAWLALNSSGLYVTGNLTVSGTGGFGNTVSITKAGGAILELNDSNQTARIRTVETGATHDLAFWAESAEKMRLKGANGNLLIGTNIDAGGKLQIATGASNTLLIGNDATYTSYNQISLNGTRTNSGVLGILGGGSGDSQLYLLAPTGGGLLFQIAGSTVFSVNSSGNATFAGNVTTSGAAQSNNGTVNARVLASGTAGYLGTSTTHDLIFQTNSADRVTINSTTGNTTFAGNVGLGASPQSGFQLDVQGLTILRGDLYMGSGKDIRLGNAYQAGAPTATGYLTIKDSNGTAYKIPAVAV